MGYTLGAMALWIITGTGTNIGKTHFCCALLEAMRGVDEDASIVGWKPVETGVDPAAPGPDELALSKHSTSKAPETIRLRTPVTPSLAAECDGVPLDLRLFCAQALAAAARYSEFVIELPGGAYSHLENGKPNAALIRELVNQVPSARVVVVAANRLGVLHDVGACLRALAADGVDVTATVLMATAETDDSTPSNLSLLRADPKTANMFLCALPWAGTSALAREEHMNTLVSTLGKRRSDAPTAS